MRAFLVDLLLPQRFVEVFVTETTSDPLLGVFAMMVLPKERDSLVETKFVLVF